MRYLGLDLGTKTLGISISDKTGMIASSSTILRHNEEYDSLLDALEDIIKDNEVEGLVLGLPKNMNNTIGERAEIALKFKDMLEERFKLPVYMQDERLSTVEAENILLTNDTSRKKRKKVIDSVAATIILQGFLDRKGR
jgi:putative Holliday junction resolvase